MIFGRELDVHIVEEAHKETFKHGNRDWKFVPTKEIFRAKKNSEATEKSDEDRKARVEGLLQKEKEKRDRLKELEIDYKFGGYQAVFDAHKKANPAAAPAKKVKTAEKKTEEPVVKKSKTVAKKEEPVVTKSSKSKGKKK